MILTSTTLYLILLCTFVSLFVVLLFVLIKMLIADVSLKGREAVDAKLADPSVSVATDQAERIIRDANLKAVKILEGSNIFDKKLHKDMSASVKNLTHTLLDTYKEVLDDENRRNIKSIEDASTEVRHSLSEEISQFGKALKEETVESEELVKQKVDAEYLKIHEGLEKYRSEKIQKIDENIYKIVVNASMNILGKATDVSSQQKLVMECLEEAKKEGFFELV